MRLFQRLVLDKNQLAIISMGVPIQTKDNQKEPQQTVL
jgi:hypothetical protein